MAVFPKMATCLWFDHGEARKAVGVAAGDVARRAVEPVQPEDQPVRVVPVVVGGDVQDVGAVLAAALDGLRAACQRRGLAASGGRREGADVGCVPVTPAPARTTVAAATVTAHRRSGCFSCRMRVLPRCWYGVFGSTRASVSRLLLAIGARFGAQYPAGCGSRRPARVPPRISLG